MQQNTIDLLNILKVNLLQLYEFMLGSIGMIF